VGALVGRGVGLGGVDGEGDEGFGLRVAGGVHGGVVGVMGLRARGVVGVDGEGYEVFGLRVAGGVRGGVVGVVGLRARGVVGVDGEGYQARAFFCERRDVLVVVGWSRLRGVEGGSSRRKVLCASGGAAVGAVPAYESARELGGETGHFGDGDVGGAE